MSKNDDSPTLPSLNPTSGAAVDVWRRRRLLLRELVFESLPLLFALVVLRLKYRVLLLKLDYLAFKRLVLLFRQRRAGGFAPSSRGRREGHLQSRSSTSIPRQPQREYDCKSKSKLSGFELRSAA